MAFDDITRNAYKILTNEEIMKVAPVISEVHNLIEEARRNEESNKASQEIRWGLRKKIIDLEKLYLDDKLHGRGFEIDENISYKNLSDEQTFVSQLSIHSYRMGIRSNDSKLVQEKRYRCKCGQTESAIAGQMCKYCGTETQYIYDIRGWFILKNAKVFNPHWISLFLNNINNKVISKKNLHESLFKFRAKKDKIAPNMLDLQRDPDLFKRWIETYASPETKEEFLATMSKAFTNKIPVMSKDFRFYSVINRIGGSPNVKQHPINRMYIVINDNVRNLNNINKFASESNKLSAISKISLKLIEILDQVIDILGKGKESMIRGKIGGRRRPYSGRLVVEGLIHPRVDACTLPYAYFGEWTIDYHRDIYLKYGMTPESEIRMKNNFPNVNDKLIMINVLRELKEQRLNYCFVYRAPCLYVGSLLSLEIIGLTNESDNCIHVSDIALEYGLKGDKDGDILGIFILTPEVRSPLHFAFNPKRLILNPIEKCINDGFELVEGIGYLCSKVLDDDVKNVVMNKSQMLKYVKENK